MTCWIAGKNEGEFVITSFVLPINILWLYELDEKEQ